MKRYILCSMLYLVVSCRTSGEKDINHSGNNVTVNTSGRESNSFKLHFNPPANSSYYYNISNESEIEIEVGGKDVTNRNKSTVGVNYTIQKDTAANFLLNLQYDKIHLYSKNGDRETEMDAGNSASATDPVEKMLGVLKDASITAAVNPKGDVTVVKGYKELGDKIMAGINAPDIASRNMMQNRLDQVIGNGLIKKNMDQLLDLYPDSSVKVGQTWKTNSKQKGEIDFNVNTIYTLKDIDDGVAFIKSTGEMANDSGTANIMGQSVSGNLNGKQEGEFEIDVQTGMVLKKVIHAKVQGTLQMMGRDIPVTIDNTIKMEGKRIH